MTEKLNNFMRKNRKFILWDTEEINWPFQQVNAMKEKAGAGVEEIVLDIHTHTTIN